MTDQTPKQILILGGSYAGLSIAHNLLKHTLSSLPNHQVTLISASPTALCRPACPRAMLSDSFFDQTKLFADIPSNFTQYPKEHFRFIQATATKLNHVERTVEIKLPDGGEDKTLPFHALVIATGASTDSPLLGLSAGGDDKQLKENWSTFRTALASASHILIAGGGPSGVEVAAELSEFVNGRPGLLQSFSKDQASKKEKKRITLLTSSERLLPVLRPALAKRAATWLAQGGVEVVTGKRVKEAVYEDGWASKAVVKFEDGGLMEADLYIPAHGWVPNASFVAPELRDAEGRVKVDGSTLRVDSSIAGPRIYALGDVASYSRPAIHLLFEAVPVLAANMKRDLRLAAGEEGEEKQVVGTKDREYKEDKRETQLVPMGKKRGLGALMGWKVPSLMVWAIKGRDYWLWTTPGLWSGKQWEKEG